MSAIDLRFDHVEVSDETIEPLPDGGRTISVKATIFAIVMRDGEPVQSSAIKSVRVAKTVGADDCLSKAFLRTHLLAKLEGHAVFDATVAFMRSEGEPVAA